MSKSIYELVNELPTDNMTIKVLKSLDFVVPGEWQNLVGFENTIREVTGETDEEMIQQIGDRAVFLFNDKSQGYQNALWLYQTVDSADSALGAAALANKIGEKIPLLGFLNHITPNPDKAQAIDLSLKLVVELVAFCQINGIPGDSIGDFVGSLGDYSGESLMRMAALVCLDGLIPFGPDFILKVQSSLSNISPKDLEENSAFNQVKKLIPGNNTSGQLDFIGNSFDSVKGWMSSFVGDRNLNPQQLFSRLGSFIEYSEDKLDYLAAFLDVTTNYYEHTGTQTLARRLIERAVAEI
ncbi:hypothetical protein [Aphanothece sacrum]|uniref:Uncharacterized protein n=1 Tax=Aphanothece sacrum FPU1 TaxID=1920663 RepID=A0A401IJT6_APHSA|nr:hypothetical protein [Aphanothece sacrum]GBF81563.1 hypothetical protein AsFPU1_2977 [Aphanothece sacrum FPU1]GBF86980.1 hypothetical protein AsFPU3_4059 [Aphanothece sacrum FPU3]